VVVVEGVAAAALAVEAPAPFKQEVSSPVTVTCYYKEKGLKSSRLSQRRNKTYSPGPLLIIGPIVKSNHDRGSSSYIDRPVEVVAREVAELKATTKSKKYSILIHKPEYLERQYSHLISTWVIAVDDCEIA
jgi:hypothetical protein